MAAFIGHGLLARHSGEFECDAPTRLGTLIDALSLSEDLRENLLAVRDKRFIEESELISRSDTVHLFIATHGG